MRNGMKATIALFGILAGAGAAHAAPSCHDGSLRGQYAFKVQGVNVGVFDAAGVLHPFDTPLPVTAVGQFTFDGKGAFKRVDFNMSNGAPTINATTPLTQDGFRTGQTGTYAIDPDCTGNMILEVPGGREIHFAIAVVGYGQRVLGVVAKEHAPGLPPALAPPGTSCLSGCELGDNILLELTENEWRRGN